MYTTWACEQCGSVVPNWWLILQPQWSGHIEPVWNYSIQGQWTAAVLLRLWLPTFCWLWEPMDLENVMRQGDQTTCFKPSYWGVAIKGKRPGKLRRITSSSTARIAGMLDWQLSAPWAIPKSQVSSCHWPVRNAMQAVVGHHRPSHGSYRLSHRSCTNHWFLWCSWDVEWSCYLISGWNPMPVGTGAPGCPGPLGCPRSVGWSQASAGVSSNQHAAYPSGTCAV